MEAFIITLGAVLRQLENLYLVLAKIPKAKDVDRGQLFHEAEEVLKSTRNRVASLHAFMRAKKNGLNIAGNPQAEEELVEENVEAVGREGVFSAEV